jgi:hypothetical protein
MVHGCDHKFHIFSTLYYFGIVNVANELQEAIIISTCGQNWNLIEVLLAELSAFFEVNQVLPELQLLHKLPPLLRALVKRWKRLFYEAHEVLEFRRFQEFFSI